jgi:hypothetical protein
MRIWPRRLVKRAVFFAAGSSIVPITIVNLAESVRFLGRRVYAGLVVVGHGDDPWPEARTGPSDPGSIANRLAHGEGWRQWWLDNFVRSSFWKAARARFMAPLCQRTLPLSLWLSFELEERQRLLAVLQFLKPITTPTAWKELAVALHLNRRLWQFTALNSWTGGLSIGSNSWKHCT